MPHQQESPSSHQVLNPGDQRQIRLLTRRENTYYERENTRTSTFFLFGRLSAKQAT